MRTENDADGTLRELDDELAGWSRSWRAAGAFAAHTPLDTAALRLQVRRRTLLFRLVTAVEIAVVFGALALLGWFVRGAADGWDLAVAAALGLLSVAMLLRGLQVASRHWGPRGETTADFLELMVRRCRALQRQVWLGWLVLAVELVVLAPWIAHTLRRRHGEVVPADAALAAWGYLALVAGGAAALLLVMRWVNERELAHWERLQAEAE